MKKILLTIFVALLSIIILATPIMATPATKTPVTATSVRTGTTSGESWVTNGGIMQFRGYQVVYAVTLNIEGESSLEGTSSNVWNGRTNMKTGEMIIHYNVVWTFPCGSFEGIIQSRLESYPQPYEYYEIHGVLQGTGVFEGQKLNLSYEGSTIDPVWEGFLIRP